MKKSNTLTMLILLAFTIIACSAQSSVSNSQVVNDWKLLGSRTVNINTDHDEISVSANKGTFRKLKFKVTRASIFVKNVRIIYGNGESENHKVNRAFKKEHFTNALDLKGGSRIIRKIVFNYTTIKTNQGKAKLTAFGKH